jgi:glycosyltransferase involved in cell wall biosynthesis
MTMPSRPRLLIFIVAYNAEKTIEKVLARIPAVLREQYETEVLVIDDASADRTFARSLTASKDTANLFPITALFNPVNQGYGGNQKLGYHYAITHGFDFVALIHGDGQYAPECLPELLEPLRRGEAAAVFGSRMLKPVDARRGGMPLYKFVGNRILTTIENKLLGSSLSEFHSGYRIYSTAALQAIPFDRNDNGFSFDTDIIIQLLIAKLPIVELPIPTYYGDEICYVNGMKYAGEVVNAALKASLQRLGFFYDRKFDCAPNEHSPYLPKLTWDSPHTWAFQYVRPGSRVLDIGCAGGYVAGILTREKKCTVDGIDSVVANDPGLNEFYLHDLNAGLPRLDYSRYDYVLMLDVIEHLSRPEAFLDELREAIGANPKVEVIISTANVAFLVTRLMLFAGQFNYGKRGILDLTHTRLLTFGSFRRLVQQSGFDVVETRGVPGPFPLALGETRLSRFLVAVNKALISLLRGVFSYQIFLRIRPKPTLQALLASARRESQRRAVEIDSAGS